MFPIAVRPKFRLRHGAGGAITPSVPVLSWTSKPTKPTPAFTLEYYGDEYVPVGWSIRLELVEASLDWSDESVFVATHTLTSDDFVANDLVMSMPELLSGEYRARARFENGSRLGYWSDEVPVHITFIVHPTVTWIDQFDEDGGVPPEGLVVSHTINLGPASPDRVVVLGEFISSNPSEDTLITIDGTEVPVIPGVDEFDFYRGRWRKLALPTGDGDFALTIHYTHEQNFQVRSVIVFTMTGQSSSEPKATSEKIPNGNAPARLSVNQGDVVFYASRQDGGHIPLESGSTHAPILEYVDSLYGIIVFGVFAPDDNYASFEMGPGFGASSPDKVAVSFA